MTQLHALTPPPAQPSRVSERPLSLLTQPARPGYVLMSVEVAPDLALRAAVNTAAHDNGLPAGLVAALTIDAARHLARASELTGIDTPTLAVALNAAARRRPAPALMPGAHRLAAYARALRAGRSADTLEGDPARIPVPAPIAAAWAHKAAGEKSVSDWATARLRDVDPVRALTWEAAAAAEGATLGEWIYAAALRELATAMPHSRT